MSGNFVLSSLYEPCKRIFAIRYDAPGFLTDKTPVVISFHKLTRGDPEISGKVLYNFLVLSNPFDTYEI